MGNLIHEIKRQNKPFTYFHTLLFNMNTMSMAQAAGTSLEIDVSINDNGELYIGHPTEFYTFKHLDPPDENLPIENVIELAKLADLYLVIDCKDVRALPWVKQIVNYYGADNVLFHSWVDVFKFEPYPHEITVEPHWKYEDLPYDLVLNLKKETGVPVISSMRGLTASRLSEEPEIIDKVIELAEGRVEVVNFNLPNGALPDQAHIARLLEHDLLVLANVDHVPSNELPRAYVGISDHIGKSTSVKDFSLL